MDILLLAAGLVVLAMAAVLAVMMWQSHRNRRLLDRRQEVIEREQRKVDSKMAEARRRGLDQQVAEARRRGLDLDRPAPKQQTIKFSEDV